LFELTAKDFETIRTRTERWKAKGYFGIDNGLNKIIDRFNRITGTTTVASCKGHDLPGKTGFYIAFASINSDFTFIHDIHDKMLQACQEMIQSEGTNNRLKRTYSYFMANMTVKHVAKIAPIVPEVNSFWYKTVVFSLNNLGKEDQETREIFYYTLRLVVKRYLNEVYGTSKKLDQPLNQ
jgi:hypothetical protein